MRQRRGCIPQRSQQGYQQQDCQAHGGDYVERQPPLAWQCPFDGMHGFAPFSCLWLRCRAI
jgi:hypothetical protein